MRIALMDDYQGIATNIVPWADRLPQAQVVAFHDHVEDEQVLVDRLAGFDVVVAMRERTPFSRSLLQRLSSLRLLVTTGMRNSAIDISAACELGIAVCGTSSSGSGPVELTWGLVLALVRHICAEDATLRAGRWQTTVGSDLAGRRLGVVGLGRLGSRVAVVGTAFAMDVVAWSPNLDPDRARAAGVHPVGKDELFATSDVVTIHMVLTERTRGLVGKEDLWRMKPSAFFVNTARAGLVDGAALLDALGQGRIAGAGLDVFDEEPLPSSHPLLRQERTVLTPHLGYVTGATYETFYGEALEDIVAFVAGHPVRVLESP